MTEYGFNTMLLHGVKQNDPYGATHTPVYQSSAFRHESAEDLENIFTNKAMGFSYTRINNPTVEAFEQRITKLERGVASVACASGMAALFNALANILQAGDEVVAAAGLYGGTVELFEDLESFGITTKYVTENEPQAYEKLITEHTRVIFAETIGNPKLDVVQTSGQLADLAHASRTPAGDGQHRGDSVSGAVRLELGADVVVNSSSKYINGNSDAISGVLT